MQARMVLVGLVVLASACGGSSSTTAPSTGTTPNTFTFTAALSPANELPAISNADSTGTGTATITMNVTRDSANAITAATTTFQVNLSGFPANTNITGAHI